MEQVHRFDIGTLRAPQRLADGRLRVDGRLSRVGVYTYRNADGTERRELRLPEEVFAKDALESFAMVPVTDDHPPTQVTSKNAKKYAVGWTGESIKADDRFVAGSLMIADADAIAKVERGKTALSCGYTCELDPTPGEHPVYGKYDAVQRAIKGNHVALVDAGRAGPDAKIRMDGVQVDDVRDDADMTAAMRGNLADAKFAVPERSVLPIEDADHVRAAMARFGQTHFNDAPEKKTAYGRIVRRAKDLGVDSSGFETAWKGRLDSLEIDAGDAGATRTDTQEQSMKIKLNGVEFDVTEQVAQAIAKQDADHQATVAKVTADAAAQVATITGERDKQAARADGAVEELAKERKLRADAEDPARLRAAINARVALETTARKHLGAEAKLDGMSERDIQLAVITKLSPAFKADGKSDIHIAERYDVALEYASTAAQAGLRVVTTVAADAAAPTDIKTARAAMIANNKKALLSNAGKDKE